LRRYNTKRSAKTLKRIKETMTIRKGKQCVNSKQPRRGGKGRKLRRAGRQALLATLGNICRISGKKKVEGNHYIKRKEKGKALPLPREDMGEGGALKSAVGELINRPQ